MTIEIQLEKIENRKENTEILWGNFKHEVVEGNLDVAGSTFDDCIVGLEKLDRQTVANRYIQDIYKFLKSYKSSVGFHYKNLGQIWANMEQVAEEQSKIIEEMLPVFNLYNTLKEKNNNKPIEEIVSGQEKEIEILGDKIVGLEDIAERLRNALEDIIFEINIAKELQDVRARANLVFKRYKIDVTLPVPEISQPQIEKPKAKDFEQSTEPKAIVLTIDEEKRAKEEVKQELFEKIMDEAKNNFIDKVTAWLTMPDAKKGNKPNLFHFVMGLINKNQIDDETLRKKLIEAGQKLSPILFEQVKKDFEQEA